MPELDEPHVFWINKWSLFASYPIVGIEAMDAVECSRLIGSSRVCNTEVIMWASGCIMVHIYGIWKGHVEVASIFRITPKVASVFKYISPDVNICVPFCMVHGMHAVGHFGEYSNFIQVVWGCLPIHPFALNLVGTIGYSFSTCWVKIIPWAD